MSNAKRSREYTVHIPVPEPGETVELHVQGLYVLAALDNSDAPIPELPSDVGGVIGYTLVDTTAPGAVRQHAAAVYQRAERKRTDTWTLCATGKSDRFRTKGARLQAPIEHVTCTNCRDKLRSEGVL